MSTIAVAIHDVEPATFDRCALIRDWLADHGVDRVTLLVVPAARPAPVLPAPPRPRRLAARLPRQRRRHRPAGLPARPRPPDGVRRPRPARHAARAWRRAAACSARRRSSRAASSPRATPTRRRCAGSSAAASTGGRRLLRSSAASRQRVRRARPLARRSPLALRAGALFAGRLLRLDLHPARLRPDPPRARARSGPADAPGAPRVTYDDLCPSPPSAAQSRWGRGAGVKRLVLTRLPRGQGPRDAEARFGVPVTHAPTGR